MPKPESAEVKALKAEVKTLKAEVKALKTGMEELKNVMRNVRLRQLNHSVEIMNLQKPKTKPPWEARSKKRLQLRDLVESLWAENRGDDEIEEILKTQYAHLYIPGWKRSVKRK
jgi:hypothetical protein